MTAHHSIANVASLIGEPTRAAMLLSLLDGCERPASELARIAHLSAAATSLHLSKLAAAGLLALRAQGRHRFYRLANADVAHAVESLGVIATAKPSGRSMAPARSALREARRCYDHLAGAASLTVVNSLVQKQLLRPRGESAFEVTMLGERWFAEVMQIDVAALTQGRRPLARRCLDWTERRPHLAGALGAALLNRMLAKRWFASVSDSRALRITSRGHSALTDLEGM
jgi:DNA-binding transcriptional ArsR family regulator